MADRPNIVFILADDMGYGDFGCFSEGRTQTPAIDSLVAEGVCLSQQYTASPVCNPSRAALLTGRYPHRTGSIDTLEWRGLERLALRETTLADMLKAAAYATALVGKWHLGAFDDRYHPTRRGFDEAVCFRGGMHDYYRWRVEFGDRVVRGDGRYLTDVWTEEACAFIERHRGRPFFLHLTYNAPHTPLQVPDAERAPFEQAGGHTWGVATVYGMIRRMDRGIGRVLETLRRCGVADDTLVVFTSDNGPQFGGAGQMCTTRFNCGYNGAKGSVYEGGVRVPAVVRWPAGGLGGDRAVGEMVHFTDWLPTLLAAAGVERPADGLPIDGVNVLPVLRGEKGKVCTRRFWQWNRLTPCVQSNAAMRDGDWKLVRPGIGETFHVPDIHLLSVSMYRPEHFIENGIVRAADRPWQLDDVPLPELYNIAADPLEQANLADKHPDRAARMLRELETWFEQVEAERRTIDN